MAKTNKKILVEVGSGKSPQPGYIHCDRYPAKDVEYVCNAWAIPFKPESINEIWLFSKFSGIVVKNSSSLP